MNKCPKCGAEFEGKFCPACGEKWEDEKICPKCGAKQNGSARFCNECGYSFVVAATGNQGGQQFQSDTKHKVFSALQIVPFVVFVLFSILLFAFYAAPVAEMILGMGFPNESLGNVYGYKTVLSDIPQLNGSMIMLFILLIFGIVFSCVMGITQVKKDLKYKEIKTGKRNVYLPALLGYISFIFYLIMLIVGIAIVITISSADEGMGILAAGACPILLIVFSIVFAAISAGALVARYLLAKNSPELKEAEAQKKEQYFESERLRKEQFYATHSEPVAPVAGEDKKANKRAAVIYKHKKRRYDKAIEKPAPAAVIWFDLHKIAIIMLAVILAVAIILIYFFVPALTNKFRISVVEKIQLGYTQEQVTEILGEPDDITDNYTSWEYYSDDYSSILVKIQKNNDEQEKAFEKGDEKKLFQLANEETKLKEQLKKVNYDFIEIGFKGDKQSGYAVSSVYFEKDCCDSAENTSTKKEVEKVELSAEEAGYYSDYTGGQKEQKLIDYNGQLYYSAYYTDGAFYRGYIKNETSQIVNGIEITTKWTDKFASYAMTYKAINIGEINEDGSWVTSKSSKAEEFFKNYCDNESNWQNGALYLGDLLLEAKSTISGNYTIKDGTRIIASKAFSNCTNITNIVVPNSVIRIGSKAFEGCTNIESITLPFMGSNWTRLSYIFNDKPYSEQPLPDSLKSVIITGGNSISDYAFYGCTSLESITIPDSVTSIGEDAFEDCTSLESVSFGNNSKLETIGKYAFRGCTSLESITIPDSVTSIGEAAFGGCIAEIIWGKSPSIQEIGYRAFGSYMGTNITIPDSVTSIGSSAFDGCASLKSISVNVNNKNYSSQDGILYDKNKTKLILCPATKTSVNIPDSVTSIGERAFGGCIAEIIWGKSPSIQEIGYRDFGSYMGTNITIPDSVTSIGSWAFDGCTSLESITIPDSVTSIDSWAFDGCTSLKSISVNVNNKNYSSQDGILYDKNKTEIIRVPQAKTEVIIPDSVTSIGDYAFEDCTSLKSVSFGNNSKLETIGSSAFRNCTSLESITIPDSVTSIGEAAFRGCTSLKSIIIGDSVTSIDSWAFDDCTSLASVTIPDSVTSIGSWAFGDCTSLESVTIPDSVTFIGEAAFYGCTSLESVTIGNGVTSIGDYAFEYCTSLESVTIGNGVTSIGSSAFLGCTSLESITIPDSVTSIGSWAFYKCTSLESVTFKNTTGWRVSKSSDMSNAQDITVTDATQNAKFLRDTYHSYNWQRYDD